MYRTYDGSFGPDPKHFTIEQLRALANLMHTMGIAEIKQDITQKESPIIVDYYTEGEQSQRMYWRKDQDS
jgi:hypothetical protein